MVDDTKGELGRSKARNLAVEGSDADWIFFLDADDRIHPFAFQSFQDYTVYDAVWGNIFELSGGVAIWRYQVPVIDSYKQLVTYDPYFTLQMGHFVRRDKFQHFNEDMNCGEDWDYYLRLWKEGNCIKINDCLFLNQRGNHSTGPRSATGRDWMDVVHPMLEKAKNEMNGIETYCGPGSSFEKTKRIRNFFHDCLKRYEINSVNDIGCGDLFWITIDGIPEDITYRGYDDCIRDVAKQRLTPNMELIECDIRNNTPSYSDLTICKDVFRHHDKDGIKAIISKIQSKYLLADFDEYTDIKGSHHRKLNDGSVYSIIGNFVDLREFIGNPIESVKADEQGKSYGIWAINNGANNL